jgi:hypothetical protein
MARKPYPSDVSDDEWALVAPYLTLITEDASQREHSLWSKCGFQQKSASAVVTLRPLAMRESSVLLKIAVTVLPGQHVPHGLLAWWAGGILCLREQESAIRATAELRMRLMLGCRRAAVRRSASDAERGGNARASGPRRGTMPRQLRRSARAARPCVHGVWAAPDGIDQGAAQARYIHQQISPSHEA